MADTKLRRGLPSAGKAVGATDRRFHRSAVKPGKGRTWRTMLRRWLLRAGAAGAALLFAVWAVYAVSNLAFFKIDRVIVIGNHRLASGEVRALLDGISQQTIFHIDLEEFRQRLLDSPWVADATLRRVFPSTVEVRVDERTPLAVARLNRQAYLVDATGVIIDAAGPQYQEFDLPIVDGLLSDGAQGAAVDPRKIELVDHLLTDLAARSDLLRRVSQIDVSDSRNAVVLLDGESARLYLGDRDFLARLQRYEESAPKVREYVKAIDYYDLRFERQFVGSAVHGSK